MKSLKLNLYDTITLCIERILDGTGQLHRMIRKCQTDSGIIFSLFSMCDPLGSSDISPEVYVQIGQYIFSVSCSCFEGGGQKCADICLIYLHHIGTRQC